jgi:hypothetical protein
MAAIQMPFVRDKLTDPRKFGFHLARTAQWCFGPAAEESRFAETRE